MLRYILSALLLSLGILPKINNLNIPQEVWQKVETKLEQVLPSPGWLKELPVNDVHSSPKPSVSPGNDRVEVYNSKSGNVITVSEEGAEHGKPFIICSEQPELCTPLPSPHVPKPKVTPEPSPTPTPTASPAIVVMSPLPTIEPIEVSPNPCGCDWLDGDLKNKNYPCRVCPEIPPLAR